jgi:DNA polymerase/3'-5' exonuclease PolX
MRLLAKKKGYNLDDHGISPALTDGEKVVLQSVPCYTEEDVFRVLGISYKHPHERNA